MPIYVLELLCLKDHLRKSPIVIVHLWIQLGSAISSLILNFVQELSFCRKFQFSVGSSKPSELPTQCWKFR
jgi:hypothetical protein